MTNVWLAAGASNWAGTAVTCYFTATADSAKLPASDEAWRGSKAPLYTVPPNTNEVVVTVTPETPSPNPYWEKTVSLSVASNGAITPQPDSSPYVTMKTAVDPFGNILNYANIQLNRFKDATTDVLNALTTPPVGRKETAVVQDHQKRYGTWPPLNWKDLPAVPNAHFLADLKHPVKSGEMNFATDPLFQNSLAVDNVVLRLAGPDPPQLFSVTWPTAIAPKKDAPPTKFLFYVRQTNSNLAGRGFFEGSVADFDYADACLFENLHYGANALRVSSATTADPLQWPFAKGVPYQVAKARVDVVSVCPCPWYYGDEYQKEYGVLNQPEKTGEILEELQAFMFTRVSLVPPKSIGKTAIAAFSSGNDVLKMWISEANQKGKFLSNTVRSLYFLDPRSDIIDECIRLAKLWAGSADKRIRLYNRISWPSHKELVASPPKEPFVLNSADDKRTLAVVGDSWKRIVTKAVGAAPTYRWDWQEHHHRIAATMLAHALAQGDFDDTP